MALQLDPSALAALSQSRNGCSYVASASYGAKQTIDSVPLTTDGQIQFDRSGQIQTQGTVYLGKGGGDSLVPKAPTDPLAPFGQEITLAYRIVFDGQTWDVPMGQLRIHEVPSTKEYFRRFPSQSRLVAWQAQLALWDRFDVLARDSFLAATAPTQPNIKAEVQSLAAASGVALVWPAAIPDATIPAGTVYQAGRLDAIAQLLTLVGCEPAMTRQGALTLRVVNAWLTATTPDVTIPATISLDDSMTADDLYNYVVITSPVDASVLATASITDESNPLRVTGPLGRRVYTNANPLATPASAQAMADTILARVSTQQAKTVTLTFPPRPDLELGDMVLAVDEIAGRQVLGQLTSMTAPMDPTLAWSGTLTVSELT